MHRFYLDSYLVGIVYLLSFGLCFFGQVLDVILIPGLVECANRGGSSVNGGYSLFGNGMQVSFSTQPTYQQPQSYVPPTVEATRTHEPQEYVPPQQEFGSGFNFTINGQPVDLSQGGTVFIENGTVHVELLLLESSLLIL